MSQVAHTAGPYPGFRSMKRLGVLPLLLDGMLVHRRLTPAFRQVSLTVCWCQFILLGGERHCETKVSCQEHNTMTRPGLEPGPFDTAESTRPPRLSPYLYSIMLKAIHIIRYKVKCPNAVTGEGCRTLRAI